MAKTAQAPVSHTVEAMQTCIQNCLDCHRDCMQAITYCVGMGGKHAEARTLQILMDCAAICETSADFMLRNSPQHGRVCAICASICEACSSACQDFSNDAEMQACAESCQRCAESCRQMAMLPD